MESLKDLKNMLKTNDLMVKIDLKDAYYVVPLNQKIKKICLLSMGREPVRVYLSHVRSRSMPPDLHKITTNPNYNFEEIEYPYDHLHRRYANNRVLNGGNTDGPGHSTTFAGSSGFRDQLPKIDDHANDRNRIFRSNNKQQHTNTINTTRETNKTHRFMPENTKLEIYNYQRSRKVDR